ncbi:hypothetical protein DYB37_006867 [Aphanomyces astaci]|nr:hypothetical protein DYB37_006867 [Aphanomyces astaci]
MWVDMTLIAVTSLSDVPLPPGHDLLGPVSPVDRLTAKSPKHATFVDPKKDLKRVRSVGFEGADIVEFEPTIFTTTVTSGGVPVGLSNMERRRIRRRLDSFELERKDE